MNISDYSFIVFDCDGVIFDSNGIKNDAFGNVTKKYGKEESNRFVTYHKENGGIARFEKFKYFLTEVMNMEFNEVEYNSLLKDFAVDVIEGYKKINVTEGFMDFMNSSSAPKYVCSGGKEDELVEIFTSKNLATHFRGIFGSPKKKEEILDMIDKPAGKGLFIGDSRYDYEVATKYNMDFIFLTKYSDNPKFAENITGSGNLVCSDFVEVMGRMNEC